MEKTLRRTFAAMGTVNSISLSGPGSPEVLDRACARVLELHGRLSAFSRESEISRINAAAGRDFTRVHPDTLSIIKTALRFSALSDGAFDITARPLTRLWGIGAKRGHVPPDDEIARARALVFYGDILFGGDGCSVMLRRPGQALDLGGIAKGYAADEVMRILHEGGIEDALINLGGTVAAMGRPRTLGIQHPERPTGTPMGKLALRDASAVTSGSYERYFVQDGVTYHHIIDPRTGRPAESGLVGITAVGASAMALDALTTAVFVMGAEKGAELVNRLGLQAVFITGALDVLVTRGLLGSFTLTDREVKI